MAIVAHELIRDEDIGGGKRLVIARYQDSTGEWHQRSWTGPITDVAQFVLDQIPQIEEDLAQQEIDAAVSEAVAGNNPDKVPVHQTQIEFDRRLIGRLMVIDQVDIDARLSALPFWIAQEGRNGNNNNARADTLGVPRTEYSDTDNVFGDLQGIQGGVNSINAKLWDEVLEAWQ